MLHNLGSLGNTCSRSILLLRIALEAKNDQAFFVVAFFFGLGLFVLRSSVIHLFEVIWYGTRIAYVNQHRMMLKGNHRRIKQVAENNQVGRITMWLESVLIRNKAH